MHIAEYCITNLASARAVAKLRGVDYVVVTEEVYPQLWHEQTDRITGHTYAWFTCTKGGDKPIAIICCEGRQRSIESVIEEGTWRRIR